MPPPPLYLRPARLSRASAIARRGVPMAAALLIAVSALASSPGAGWPAGGARVLAACGSFQALVNAAPSGGTITVPPCTYLEAVTINKPLTLNASGAVVDGQNVRTHGISVTANDVTINGLTVTRVKNDFHVGAVWTTGVSRFTFRNGVARDSTTVCLSLNGGSGHRILDSELTGCGQEGFFTNGVSATLFSGNRIHHNHLGLAYAGLGEAGGGKASASSGVTFDANEVAFNRGPGIWFDNGVANATATNNRVHDNDGEGIFFEISQGAEISGNAVWSNGFYSSGWGYGAGITISSSDRALVHDNTVAWNARGISVISQDRGPLPHDGNVVHDNVVISSSGTRIAGWYDDHGGSLYAAANGNHGYGDRFWGGPAEPTDYRFEWNGGRTTISAYNATPGEEGGSNLSLAERDAALAAAGIPQAGGAPAPIPTPGIPVLQFRTGQLGGSTVPGAITWSGVGGASAYQLQVQRDGGSWGTVPLSSATARSKSVTYTLGHRYAARVRAKVIGVWSAWRTSPVSLALRYQETAGIFSWVGRWKRVASTGASGSYVRYATSSSARARISFTGRAVSWVAPRSASRGSARVYLDGVYRTTVSLYRSSSLTRQLVFRTAWATTGPHVLEIRVVGTSGHPRVDIDAVTVLR